MSIHSINNNNYQNQNSEKSDFQTAKTDANALQIASGSGDQDQVAISESALSTALSSTSNNQGISSSESTLSKAVSNVLNDLFAMNSQALGRIHQLQLSTVKALLHQT